MLCSYFLDNAERICNTNYVPTVKDILHARLKTTGASELNFEVKQHKFLYEFLLGRNDEGQGEDYSSLNKNNLLDLTP